MIDNHDHQFPPEEWARRYRQHAQESPFSNDLPDPSHQALYEALLETERQTRPDAEYENSGDFREWAQALTPALLQRGHIVVASDTTERLFQAVRRVIVDGIDSPGTLDELHRAFYEFRETQFVRATRLLWDKSKP